MIRYAFGNVLGSIWKFFNDMVIVGESVIVFLMHLEMTTMASDDTYFIFNDADLIPHFLINAPSIFKHLNVAFQFQAVQAGAVWVNCYLANMPQVIRPLSSKHSLAGFQAPTPTTPTTKCS